MKYENTPTEQSIPWHGSAEECTLQRSFEPDFHQEEAPPVKLVHQYDADVTSVPDHRDDVGNQYFASRSHGPVYRGGLPQYDPDRTSRASHCARGSQHIGPPSPVPSPPRPLSSRASSSFQYPLPVPLLQQSSSMRSVYSHHSRLPSQVCLTASGGQRLISQPLLETPRSILTPNSDLPSCFKEGSIVAKKTPTRSPAQTPHTPGLDLLADQIVTKERAFLGVPWNSWRSRPFVGQNYASNPACAPSEYECQPPVRFSPRPQVAGEILPPIVESSSIHEYRPPANPVESYPFLFAQAPMTSKPCKCANSKCLKLYCECFRNGVLCDKNLCRCKDCNNNQEKNGPKGKREYAILRIMAKKPNAFHIRPKRRVGNWCRCPKSHCLKKYCECLSAGRLCTENCKCQECKNTRPGTQIKMEHSGL